MQHIPDNQCRRCGRMHEEVWQVVDHAGCWALATTKCECGHHWTIIYTAPNNLASLRAWLARDCQPEDGPVGVANSRGWRPYRLEGVFPALARVAS